jgi:carbonic anhydrase
MTFIKNFYLSFFLTSLFLSEPLLAMENYEVPDDNKNTKRAFAMLNNLKIDNDKFVHKHGKTYFKEFMNKQHPRMTLIMCVDSRCHHHAFDKTPDNDIYMVRNFSGQYSSNKGSILYGVEHNDTPLLVVMGHDDCGAVTTKTKLKWLKNLLDKTIPLDEKYKNKDVITLYSQLKELQEAEKLKESKNEEIPTQLKKLKFIIDELTAVEVLEDSIPPSEGNNEIFSEIVHQNIKFNIHKQVDECLQAFHEKVKSGDLIILGALYDFQNREEEGHGKLIWIDARSKDNVGNFIEDGKLINSGVKVCKKSDTNTEITSLPRINGTIENGDVKYEEDHFIYVVHKKIKSTVEKLKEKILTSLDNKL